MLPRLLTVLLLTCLAISAICCVCGGLVLLAGEGVFESARAFVTAPFRWFQPEVTSPDLYQILSEGREASFRLGQPCEFQSVAGNVIQSPTDPGGQFARPLTRQEAIDAALASLGGDSYLVQDRSITLNNSTPVRYQQTPGEGIFLAFDEQANTDVSVASRSLNGVVQGNLLNGSLHLAEDRFSVENGQGVEASSAVDVIFTCPLLWEN
jgi:hypothetical protein